MPAQSLNEKKQSSCPNLLPPGRDRETPVRKVSTRRRSRPSRSSSKELGDIEESGTGAPAGGARTTGQLT